MTDGPGAPVAVVTGAASGIGYAFVRELARRGYSCVGADIDESALAALGNELESTRWLGIRADISSAADVERLAELSFARFGRVDLLVNNAGILATGRSWEMPIATWRKVLDVNLLGPVNAVHSFVPRLIAQGNGHIVNMASAAALAAHAHTAAYAASKHGLLALSEALARELEAMGSPVRVSVVFPGAVKTGIARDLSADAATVALPINRLLADLATKGAEPDDVVAQVLSAVGSGTFAVFPQVKVRDRAAERLSALLDGKLPGS